MRAGAATVYVLMLEEIRLHYKRCAAEGLSGADLSATEKAPAHLACTRNGLDAGHSRGFLDPMATLALRAHGNGEIGARLAAKGGDTPFCGWIATYGGDAHQGTCRAVGALIDPAVERRIEPEPEKSPHWPRLAARFATAARIEIAFSSMGLGR